MALINDASEIQPYLPASYNMQGLPAITLAEEKYLLPIIGEALYNDLQDAMDNDSLTENDEKLLDKCRAVIVPFAFVEDAALKQVLLTDNGFVALESPNAGSRKAWKWEYNNAVEALIGRGYDCQEQLIRFLKSNTGIFPDWNSSPYNDANGFYLIRDGGDLRGLLALQQPHRVYMSVKPILLTIAESYLKPAISEEYYAVLNDRIKNNTLTDADNIIMPKLRMAAARMAMVMSTSELDVIFSGTQFTVVDTRIKDNINEGRTHPDTMQMDRFKGQHEGQARQLIEQMKNYMNNHPDLYPEYAASDAFVDPNKVSKKIDNSQLNGFFATN